MPFLTVTLIKLWYKKSRSYGYKKGKRRLGPSGEDNKEHGSLVFPNIV